MPLPTLAARLHRAVTSTSVYKIGRRAGSRLYRRIFPFPRHPFDVQHGVDTSGLFYGNRLSSGHPHDAHITAYWGTAPSMFRVIMDYWKQRLHSTPYSVEDYSFLDIGCGKGRVVMLATELPFRSVTGVELSPELAKVGQANLAIWRSQPHACTDFSVLNADALEFALPDGPVLIYLFNPFDRELTQRLLHRLETLARTRSAPTDLIYTHPTHADLVQSIPGVASLWQGEIEYSPEDASADVFQGHSDVGHIYRLPASRPRSVSLD